MLTKALTKRTTLHLSLTLSFCSFFWQYTTSHRCFGFTNVRNGIECRGEEHEIVLTWSVVSDKVKVVWNKKDISHYFASGGTSGIVDVNWQTTMGESFRILAHESPVSPSIPQYNFFIDGYSIFYLQHVSELPGTTIIVDKLANYEAMSETSMDSAYSSEARTSDEHATRDAHNIGCFQGFLIEDDLIPSYSFTNILEYLRGAITSIMPNLEDMVSRSIINALSEDRNVPEADARIYHDSSSISSSTQTPTEIEANLLYETTKWANKYLRNPQEPDIQEKKRLFLQKKMDAVFVLARHERLTEDTAARILFDMATLLGYPDDLTMERERDTIIFRNLKSDINSEALANVTMMFDEIREVGVATNRRFAFCRFATGKGPLRALAAADQGTLLINGYRPNVSMIQKPTTKVNKPGTLSRRARSTPFGSSEERPLTRQRSHHKRNTVSIDSLKVENPSFLRLINELG